jgi:hypothetical protein
VTTNATTYDWSCQGINGGANANCQARVAAPVAVSECLPDGACGMLGGDGGTVYMKFSTSLACQEHCKNVLGTFSNAKCAPCIEEGEIKFECSKIWENYVCP